MRISNRRKKIQEPLLSSRRIFYVLFSLFIIIVIGRFVAIQQLEHNEKINYLFSFQNIYAKFTIENNQTHLTSSKNISLNSSQNPIPPYTLVTLHLGESNATYQLIPNKKTHTISLLTRPAWYEIIGGTLKTRDGASIVRLNAHDSPLLLVRNHELQKSLYHAKTIEIIALQKGLYYHSATSNKIPIPYYKGTLKELRRSHTWKHVKSIVMEKSGVISYGNKILHIAMGQKNMSRLVDKKKKKYNLYKASSINISVTDNKTPSSTLKLVQADFALYETKLTYHFSNIAHLLLKYQINHAKKTILFNTLSKSLLKKELNSKIEDFKKFKTSKTFNSYQEHQKALTQKGQQQLNQKLVKAVIQGDFYRAKKMILLGADVNTKTSDGRDLLLVVLQNQQRYLPLPSELKFVDNELILKGNNSLFNFKSYFSKSHFSTQVPILDKPKIPQKETLRSEELNQFVDVTHLNGLYVSDAKAQVYYGKTTKSFREELLTNYQKAPPLFLYENSISGKFVAPNTPTKKTFYYKIVSQKSKVTIAFNGHIKIYQGKRLFKNYNSITPFLKTYTIPLKNHSVIIEVNFSDKLLPCGILFSSKEKISSLIYSFNAQEYHSFEIIDQGDGYFYKIKEDGSKTFKNYTISLKSKKLSNITFLGNNHNYAISTTARTFNYTPSLSCLATPKKNEYLSLYDNSNKITLIPKEFSKTGMRPKLDNNTQKQNNSQNHKETNLNPKLLPIYGDGLRFGLTSHDVTAEELTLDQNFSNQVGTIFTEVIESLSTQKEKNRRKEHNTILEGASVVLADKGEGKLEVVAMFSYPYPTSLDSTKPESYKKELFKYMLLDEFNNKHSLLKNRALNMRIRPGSTFKMVTAMAGFKSGIIPLLDRRFSHYIEGKQDLYGTQFKRGTNIGVHLKNFSFSNGEIERTHGANFKNSFKFSYNVYFGYLALMLHKKLDKGYKKVLYPISSSLKKREDEFPLMRVAHDLGFNKSIPLSKTKNIKATPSNFPNQFILAKEIADTGIGQFEITATPMQMAIVANTIRTRSIVYPTIIKNEPSKIIKKEFISSYAQHEIKEAMYQVVNASDGTAKCAFLHENFYQKAKKHQQVNYLCTKYRQKFKAVNPKAFNLKNVKVYGKTGTAEKGKGKLYDGWFVAFTKSPKGDIVVATVVRNSGTGGTYSATITKRIVESWYEYQEKINKNEIQ